VTDHGITIRRARETDLETINRIYNHEILTGTATWDEEPWDAEKRRQWFAAHDGETPVLVAELPGGAVAGFACLTKMSQKSGWRFTRENTIYLDEAFRGRGIGKALLTALLNEARRIGMHLVVAAISAENEVSIDLHRRLGYTMVGTIDEAGFKFGRWLGATYMQRIVDGDE